MSKLSKEQVIQVYRDLVAEHGGNVIGVGVFMRKTGLPKYYWSGRYWRSWSAFQFDCGIKPNKATEKIPDDILLKKYVELIEEIKEIPIEADILIKKKDDPTFPSKNAYRRWGSRNALIDKATEFCRSNKKYKIALNILQTGISTSTDTRLTLKKVKGFVYLLRSGKNYKIGRTNAIGRRLNELAIQLPQKPDTIHVIETDDPEGIEQYWHKRFAEKRQGGEWFSLTKDDVNAFKMRTFQ
ncbi:MAG: GIY-YIG nuclease family protein [Candidatus Marinimicrobia bacterium]|nr:GIY-YIG nuclease family protein [Candidatus Neomarinimicrobiota bacterium]